MNWLKCLSHSAFVFIFAITASMQADAAGHAPTDPEASPQLVQVGMQVAHGTAPINYLGHEGARTTVSVKGEYAFAVTVVANGASEYKIEIEPLKQTQTARSGSMGSPQYLSLGVPLAVYAQSGIPVNVNVHGLDATITVSPGNTPAVSEILRMQAINSSGADCPFQNLDESNSLLGSVVPNGGGGGGNGCCVCCGNTCICSSGCVTFYGCGWCCPP